jgi:hypothetical protein
MKSIVAAVACVIPAVFLAQAAAQPLLPGERETVVSAIPGVVAAGAKWELVWADFETADGILGTDDGGVLFAQEQTDTIRKLAPGLCPVGIAESGGEGAVDDDIDSLVDLTRDLGIVAPAGTGFAAAERIRRYIITGGFTATVLTAPVGLT